MEQSEIQTRPRRREAEEDATRYVRKVGPRVPRGSQGTRRGPVGEVPPYGPADGAGEDQVRPLGGLATGCAMDFLNGYDPGHILDFGWLAPGGSRVQLGR
jgi:hypothetical protein